VREVLPSLRTDFTVALRCGRFVAPLRAAAFFVADLRADPVAPRVAAAPARFFFATALPLPAFAFLPPRFTARFFAMASSTRKEM
jgi:hypothetical protein